jgi:hypothetical protein
MTRTITINELMKIEADTFSVKDNSVKGYKTIDKKDVKIGDKVILNNYFTLVVE